MRLFRRRLSDHLLASIHVQLQSSLSMDHCSRINNWQGVVHVERRNMSTCLDSDEDRNNLHS